MGIMGGSNPMEDLVFDRKFILEQIFDDRLANRDTQQSLIELDEFTGCEPQLIARVSENLALVEDLSVIQKSPYRIHTEKANIDLYEQGVEIKKGLVIKDTVTDKRYRVLAPYVNISGITFMVTELDD